MIIVVGDPETGSATSIGGLNREECLEKAIRWLGGEFSWAEEEN
jgi:hypothetical protein